MSVKVHGLADLAKRLEGRTDKIRKAVDNELTDAAKAIEERAVLLAPDYRGHLRGQIFAETTVPFYKVVVSQAEYAAYLEFGTKSNFRPNGRADIAKRFQGPGKGGGDMVKNIHDWLKRKGYFPAEVTSPKARMGYARFVAKRIAMFGIKPANNGTGYFYRSYDELLPAILKNIETILK